MYGNKMMSNRAERVEMHGHNEICLMEYPQFSMSYYILDVVRQLLLDVGNVGLLCDRKV